MKIGFARAFLHTLRDRINERRIWLRLAPSVEGTIAWGVEMVVHPDSDIVVGASSFIGHGTVLAVRPGEKGAGSLHVGRETYIGEYNNLRAVGSEIRIGDHCLISQFVSLIANGHAYERRDRGVGEQGVSDRCGLVVGNDVWIGCQAVVLPGVMVGEGAVIAAGSVVTHDVAPYTVVAGSPARPVGERK